MFNIIILNCREDVLVAYVLYPRVAIYSNSLKDNLIFTKVTWIWTRNKITEIVFLNLLNANKNVYRRSCWKRKRLAWPHQAYPKQGGVVKLSARSPLQSSQMTVIHRKENEIMMRSWLNGRRDQMAPRKTAKTRHDASTSATDKWRNNCNYF